MNHAMKAKRKNKVIEQVIEFIVFGVVVGFVAVLFVAALII